MMYEISKMIALHFLNVVTIYHQQMALSHYHIMHSFYKNPLCPFLTLYHSQHLCNPRWPGGVSGDALNC